MSKQSCKRFHLFDRELVAMKIMFLVTVILGGIGDLSAQSSPGSLDPSFGTGGYVTTNFGGAGDAYDVAIQTDGKIVVVGNGTTAGFWVARYNIDGSLDTTFDSDGKVITTIGNLGSGARVVAIQANGKIVVAGNTIVAGDPGHEDFAVVRYNANGTLDTTFDGDGIATIDLISGSADTVQGLVIQSDGKIVAGGFSTVNSSPFYASVVRFNTNGTLDTTFDGDGKLILTGSTPNCIIPYSIALQSDDKVILVGNNGCTALGGDFAVFRLNHNGSPDTTFDDDGMVFTNIVLYDNPRDVSIQSDGKILVTGFTDNNLGDSDIAVVRYNTNGSLDSAFDGDGIVTTKITNFLDDGHGISIQKNGKISVVGMTRPNSVNDKAALVRYNGNGSLDNSFGTNGIVTTTIGTECWFRKVASQSDGKIVAVGQRSNGGGHEFLVARYLGDSTQFDFDGDRKTDIGVFRPTPREWWISRSGNSQTFATQFGASADIIAPADFTGDGKTDLAFWRPANGEWFVLRSEDNTFYAFPFGANGDVPIPGDFDGDGKSDAAVFRPSNLTWYINKSTGGTDIVTFGASGDKPIAADYDGDGKADIAVFRPSGANGAEWWIRRSSNATVFATQFGSSTDKAVPADYTGDGKADIAFWTPSSGNWFVLRSEDFSYFAFPFGSSTDIPSPGDYDGDGKMDAAVFRPSNSTWYVQRSTAGLLIQQFGAAGDVPVPSAFVR